MASQVSVLKLFDLVQSHRVTAVIYVAVRLGIAELCGAGRRRSANSQRQPVRMNDRSDVY
jgi:hypothetical protein